MLKQILSLSFANALNSLHYFLVLYIASSFLEQYLPNTQNGIVFSIAAALMLIGFIFAPSVLTRISVRRASLLLAITNTIVLLILASNPWPVIAIFLIALHTTVSTLIAYSLDLLLENATETNQEVGRIHGLFLTFGNVALVTSPLLIGILLDASNTYSRIFLASATTLVFFIILLATQKNSFIDTKSKQVHSLRAEIFCLISNKEVRSVLIANLILQSFYIWATIYIPLYLHTSLGFSWETLGPLFALMLLPFLLIELPLGLIEDKIKGSRFIMTIGFLILGFSFMAFSFVTATTNVAIITFILISTRVGAALIEITAETSFFRDVGGKDVEGISFFRMTRPLGMLIGPLIGSLFLVSMPLQSLFIPLGIICLFGIPFALHIRDGISTGVRTALCSVR